MGAVWSVPEEHIVFVQVLLSNDRVVPCDDRVIEAAAGINTLPPLLLQEALHDDASVWSE